MDKEYKEKVTFPWYSIFDFYDCDVDVEACFFWNYK